MTAKKGLTRRQLEIMNLVKLGHANKQIGYELGISINTVKTIIRAAMKRLGANDRTHTVYLCVKRGIID